VGLVGRAWLAGSSTVGEKYRLEEELGPAGAPMPEDLGSAGFAENSDAFSSARPVMTLAREDAALFGVACDLQLMAEGTNLQLSGRQWTALATVVAELQAVRRNYEAGIAQVREVAPGRYRLEIPAYPEAGDELRRRFHAELQTALGAEVAAELNAKLGSRLEGHFAGFGVGNQTLEIVGDPLHAPEAVQVERVARYWNSREGGDRVTTRREVNLPAIEDPVGESWPALLALVIKAD